MLFHQGRPDEQAILEGPQDEATLRQYFAAFAPREELLLEQAKQALAAEQSRCGAQSSEQGPSPRPERHDISLWLAQAALDLNLLDEAQSLLVAIPMVAQDDHYQTLSSRLSLAQQASDSPELRALELRHAEQPDDAAIAQELAVLYSQVGRQEEALALLFTILKRDLAFGDAKKIYLDVLATMGTPGGTELPPQALQPAPLIEWEIRTGMPIGRHCLVQAGGNAGNNQISGKKWRIEMRHFFRMDYFL